MSVVVLLVVLVIAALLKSSKKTRDRWTQAATTPVWSLCGFVGLRRDKYQYLMVLLVIIPFVLVIKSLNDKGVEAILIGSLIGALPLVIFEANKLFRKPYVTLEEIWVVKYPKSWYTFDSPRTSDEASNAIGIHGVLKNQGRETAKGCNVKIHSDSVKNQEYHTRWSDSNAVELDLAPKEDQVIDILWMDLRDEYIQTADPDHNKQEEHHYPPGKYSKIIRPELSNGEHEFQITVTASNMTQVDSSIAINDSNEVEIPDDLIEAAAEWSVIEAVKENSNSFVIHYIDRRGKVIEKPDFVDTNALREIEEFSGDRIGKEPGESYSRCLARKYEIIEL